MADTNAEQELVQVAAVALSILENHYGHTRSQAIALVSAERLRQLLKWGDQTGYTIPQWIAVLGEEFGEFCQAAIGDGLVFENTTKEIT